MIIETPRLLLRPHAETDLRDALAVLGDPETMNFYPSPYSENEVAAAIRSSIETYRLHGYGRFAVIEKASGHYVGDCGITIQDIDGAKEHEVGYRIGKARWGRGYAHEAAAAVVQYGFETLALSRLCSYMASDHLQSRRVAEKLGMVLEKQYRNPRNRDYLTCVYAIHRTALGSTHIPGGS
jgi:[ribosomal protein S5]-alanine N-acetyltransferase